MSDLISIDLIVSVCENATSGPSRRLRHSIRVAEIPRAREVIYLEPRDSTPTEVVERRWNYTGTPILVLRDIYPEKGKSVEDLVTSLKGNDWVELP